MPACGDFTLALVISFLDTRHHVGHVFICESGVAEI